jgi:hypothetical protein
VKSNTSTGTDTYTPSLASGAALPGTNTSCSITVQ